ncbi:Cytochrome C oxidase, cbb3-type, subunit III [Chitinophaga sp. YR627]|uniref:c-type cytochrome n=1 Tax=Chitinophaga sp. YR627 TaxID=1881041 RepID=UPI0008E35286|nr:cytochrome c [Chitinophaga sp. YR627]SFO59771.1 Cytochrome C oxidase, cbb3-type, subunit III [Chitinophaga sp. YR627]
MKKVFFSLIAVAIACSTIIVSCSKSNEQDITNPPGNGGGGGGGNTCDTVNMKYATDVLPILQSSCYSCHGNGNVSGGVSLGSYASVKTQADNGNLVGVITHAAGYPAMPQGGAKLSDCNINKIKAWIARGALNN